MAKTKVLPAVESNSNGSLHREEKSNPGTIDIPAPDFEILDIEIIGVSPLMVRAWTLKALQEMESKRLTDESLSDDGTKRSGKRKARPARNFDEEFRDCLYPLDGQTGFGFPAVAFKHAMVGACRLVSNIDMTLAKRIIHVHSTCTSRGMGMVEIKGKPQLDKVMVRLKGRDRPPDLHIRGRFFPWRATLRIEYCSSKITRKGIFYILQYAGKCEGVGEQRPSSPDKSGDNGQFRLAEGKE